MRKSFVVVLICLTLIGGQALAQDGEVDQIILVLWHGLPWDAAQELQFKAPRAMGFLNTRVAGGEPLTAAYLSIGAGARAMGLAGAALFYQGDAGGKDLYMRHTGLEPTEIVQPRIAQIQAAQTVSYKIEPGALGTALAEAGLPLRVLGNSDTHDPVAWSALVGMDEWGRVWEGSIGEELTLFDASFPYGLRTDYATLAQEVLAAEEKLIIVDLGDPFRFDQYQGQLVPSQQEAMRRVIFAEARDFLATIVEEDSKPRRAVWLVSPYPSHQAARAGYWLTPVLCWGLDAGLLISGTTRWPGLITNMDIAPTMLELLGTEHDQPFIGRSVSIQAQSEKESLVWLETMAAKIGVLFGHRGQVLRALVIAQILVYAAVLIALIAPAHRPTWIVLALQFTLLLLMAMPLGLLLWGLSPLLVILLLIGIGVLKYKGTSSLPSVGFITLSTTLAIAGDVLFGSWLMRYSFLGYDPVGGARFYGLGNEYMGVLIGSAIMGWSVIVEVRQMSVKGRGILGGLAFAGLTYLVGAPSLGTNVGGAISCVLGFGSTWLALGERKVRFRTIMFLAILTVLVLGGLMLTDSNNPGGEQSHIGQTVELVRRDGLTAIYLIITRKLAMNMRLLRYSMWSNALIVALVGMGASLIWPSKYIAWLKKNHPLIAKGIVGVVIGSTSAFAFNDSGVVAAATCLSFASSTLLLLALELKHDFTPSQTYIEDDGYSH